MAVKRIKTRLVRFSGIVLFLVGVASLYQNCGGGFESGRTLSSDQIENIIDNEIEVISNAQGVLWFAPVKVRNLDENNVLVLDRAAEALSVVSLLDGTRRIISGLGAGMGLRLENATSFTLGVNGVFAYVTVNFDDSNAAVVAVNLNNGERTLISGDERGLGDSLLNASDVWAHPNGQVLYVLQAGGGEVYSINIASGDRTLLATVEGGAFAMSVNEDGTQLYTVGSGQNVVKSLDVLNSITTVVSSDSVGLGPVPLSVLSLDVDRAQNFAYILDVGLNAIYQVNLITGDRQVVADAQRGLGSNFSASQSLVLNPNLTVAYVVDSGLEALFAVNLGTGDRRIVSSAQIGSGYELNFSPAGALSPDGNSYYALENSLGRIFRVSLGTGTRQVVSGAATLEFPAIGSGPSLNIPIDMQLNNDGSLAYVLGIVTRAIYRVNLLNGNRELIVDQTTGVGPEFPPLAMHINQAETEAYVTSSGVDNSVYRVNLATGDRVLISGPTLGAGPEFSQATNIILNPAEDTAFVVADNAVFGINLATGDRALISGQGVGLGDDFLLIRNLEPNSDFTSLYVGGANLYELDLATGNRRVVSGLAAGSGAFNLRLGGFDVRPDDSEVVGYSLAVGSFLRINLANGNKTVFSN